MTAHSPPNPCLYCGKPLPESATTCDKCGKPLPPLPHLESGFPLVKKRYEFYILAMFCLNTVVMFSAAGIMMYGRLRGMNAVQNPFVFFFSGTLSFAFVSIWIIRNRLQRFIKQNESKPD